MPTELEKAAEVLTNTGQEDLAELLGSGNPNEPEALDLGVGSDLMELLGVAGEETPGETPEPGTVEGRLHEMSTRNNQLNLQNQQLLGLLAQHAGPREEDPNAPAEVSAFDFDQLDLQPPLVDGERMSKEDFRDEMRVFRPVFEQVIRKQNERAQAELTKALAPLQKQVDLVSGVTSDHVMERVVGKDWSDPNVQRVVKALHGDVSANGANNERAAAIFYAAAKYVLGGEKPPAGRDPQVTRRRGMIEGGSVSPKPDGNVSVGKTLENATDAEVLALVDRIGG